MTSYQITVYRVGSKKWSNDVTGEGAKKTGGRWNLPGIPCIYTAQSRALCTLEYSAHMNLDSIPAALTITRYKIPEAKIQFYKVKDLPGNWRSWPHEQETREFGSQRLTSSGPLIMAFPSVLIPQEYNFVLNIVHPDFSEILIDGIESYSYDIRIKD